MFYVIEDDLTNCLTGFDSQKHSSLEVIKAWENSYKDRRKVLLVPDKHLKTAVEKYLRSFACLCMPLGIALVKYYNKLYFTIKKTVTIQLMYRNEVLLFNYYLTVGI